MNIPTVRNGSVDLGAWRSIAPSKKGAAWRRRIVPRSITWKDLLATYGSKPHVRRVDTPDPVTRLNAALEGRYRIERQLDEGGMARVYLAGTAPVAAAMRYSGGRTCPLRPISAGPYAPQSPTIPSRTARD